MSNQKILHCFFDADMRCSHDGLAARAAKDKVNVKTLDTGQYIVFVNSAKNRIKLYAANETVAYYRAPKGVRIDLGVIVRIPANFAATGRIDYTKALKETVEKALSRKNT